MLCHARSDIESGIKKLKATNPLIKMDFFFAPKIAIGNLSYRHGYNISITTQMPLGWSGRGKIRLMNP